MSGTGGFQCSCGGARGHFQGGLSLSLPSAQRGHERQGESVARPVGEEDWEVGFRRTNASVNTLCTYIFFTYCTRKLGLLNSDQQKLFCVRVFLGKTRQFCTITRVQCKTKAPT